MPARLLANSLTATWTPGGEPFSFTLEKWSEAHQPVTSRPNA